MFQHHEGDKRNEGFDKMSFSGREISKEELQDIYHSLARGAEDLRGFLKERLSALEGVTDREEKIESLFAAVWDVAKDRAITQGINTFLREAFRGERKIPELKEEALRDFPWEMRTLARGFREEALLAKVHEQLEGYFQLRNVEDRLGLEASFLREIRAASRIAESQMRRMGY